MSGNEKRKDPWGPNPEGPPDLDEALKQLQQKIKNLFGGNLKGNTGGPRMGGDLPANNKRIIYWILGSILAIYLLSGIYIVQQAEEAVILRFGRYVRTEGPGPHWLATFIETKDVLNVQEVKTTKHGGQMLTKDENIVSAEIAVQYRISNAKDYLFNVDDPDRTLQQVSESALRGVIGESTLSQVLTSGRSEIGSAIRKLVQDNLNLYQSGLEISDLAMQQTKAPEQVKDAFDDAIKAQQDEERQVNEAEAYARKIVPIAEGRAKRTFEEARAYRERVILEAQGKTAKFLQILPEYRRAPQVTRERMFLDTLQEVYGNTAKILIDSDKGSNLIYLPLDKLIQPNNKGIMPPVEDESSPSKNEKNPYNKMTYSQSMYDENERLVHGGDNDAR